MILDVSAASLQDTMILTISSRSEEDETGARGKPERDSSEDADKNDDTHPNADDDYHYGMICTGNGFLNKHHLTGIFTVHLAGEVNMGDVDCQKQTNKEKKTTQNAFRCTKNSLKRTNQLIKTTVCMFGNWRPLWWKHVVAQNMWKSI